MPLHMTKIAFGAESPAHLRQRLETYAEAGEIRLTTRYLPKRHEEMVGGSLYWILNHMLVGRSPILGFMDNGQGRDMDQAAPRTHPCPQHPQTRASGLALSGGKDAPPDLGSAMQMAAMKCHPRCWAN
jgi:hypothetical protein